MEKGRGPGAGGFDPGGNTFRLRPGDRKFLRSGGAWRKQPAPADKQRGEYPTDRGGDLCQQGAHGSPSRRFGKSLWQTSPKPRIEIVTVDSGEEAQALLESGEADLVELSQAEQPACVEQGLLLELSSYLKEWEETSSLTAAAQQVIAAMGADPGLLAACHFEPGRDLLPEKLGSKPLTRARQKERAWCTAAFGRTSPQRWKNWRTRGQQGWCSAVKNTWGPV